MPLLAPIAATAFKGVHPIEIQPGTIDTAGYGGGHNDAAFAPFAIPDDLLEPQANDCLGQPGYRFWFVLRDQVPALVFEAAYAIGAYTLKTIGEHTGVHYAAGIRTARGTM
ncbi:MAG: hypothetical protein L0H73_12165 [Nitrococcus sp.]|nr:hypothetical protein [Nitrococcus sp.]